MCADLVFLSAEKRAGIAGEEISYSFWQLQGLQNFLVMCESAKCYPPGIRPDAIAAFYLACIVHLNVTRNLTGKMKEAVRKQQSIDRCFLVLTRTNFLGSVSKNAADKLRTTLGQLNDISEFQQSVTTFLLSHQSCRGLLTGPGPCETSHNYVVNSDMLGRLERQCAIMNARQTRAQSQNQQLNLEVFLQFLNCAANKSVHDKADDCAIKQMIALFVNILSHTSSGCIFVVFC